jgi:hypothetical protein
MIARLLSPSTASTRFSVDLLPDTIHGSTLWNVIAPIVNSESMTPTLQIGDELELEQADHLQVGDVVVYRHHHVFICHRIHRIEHHRLFLRGDASTGHFEEVDIGQAVGRVASVRRKRQRMALHHSLRPRREPAGGSLWLWVVNWTVGPGRWLVLRCVNSVAGLPGVKAIVRRILRTLMTLEIVERASLYSLEGYVTRQQVHLDHLASCRQYLSPLNRLDIVLVVRAGPLYLGTCTLNPWHIAMRPLLNSLATDVLSESIGVCVPTHTSSHSTQRSTTIGKQ